jgi:ParB family chromosome partitioning protein
MNDNPLGKGLEALIPPQKQKTDGDFGANLAYPMSVQPVSLAGGSAEDLPAGRQESAKVFESVSSKIETPASSAPVEIHPAQPKKGRAHQIGDKEAIYYIEVEKVRPNPDQPRREFNEDALRELASSIREFGLLQPIVVSKVEKDTEKGTEVEYELVAGERRLMAVKMLGLETIPAIIRNVRLERERLELAIVENIQRENLNPIEMAKAYSRLQDEFRLTQREVASRLGKSRETVANTLRLLDLSTEIQDAISKGQLTESHGRLLLTIDDQAVQNKLFQDLIANKLTTRELKDQAAVYVRARHGAKQEVSLPPEIKMAEERLTSEFGTPVVIKQAAPPAGGGKITIAFYSKEELINLLKRLGAQEDDSLSL